MNSHKPISVADLLDLKFTWKCVYYDRFYKDCIKEINMWWHSIEHLSIRECVIQPSGTTRLYINIVKKEAYLTCEDEKKPIVIWELIESYEP